MLGVEDNFGPFLGLDKDWAHRIIKLVGNYGEAYDRNFGMKSPLKLDRAANKQWYDGGLYVGAALELSRNSRLLDALVGRESRPTFLCLCRRRARGNVSTAARPRHPDPGAGAGGDRPRARLLRLQRRRQHAAAPSSDRPGFLDRTAGFDIPFTLIGWSPDDTFGRAILVGLLNTLLVFGLVDRLTTLLGFVFGLMRLSSNGLTRGTAGAYVEVIRNTPVLIQVIFIYMLLGAERAAAGAKHVVRRRRIPQHARPYLPGIVLGEPGNRGAGGADRRRHRRPRLSELASAGTRVRDAVRAAHGGAVAAGRRRDWWSSFSMQASIRW